MAVTDQRRPHWFWMYNSIIDDYGPELGPLGIAVYCALARHANAGGECWPCLNTLALEIHASPVSVRRALKKLASKEIRLLRITPRVSPRGDWTSNLYTLLDMELAVDAKSRKDPETAAIVETIGRNMWEEREEATSSSGESALTLRSPLSDVCESTGTLSETGGPLCERVPPDQWAETLAQLRLQMTRGVYDTWLRDTTAERSANLLTVYVPSAYAQDWLHQRLRRLIERTVTSVYDAELTIAFTIRPADQGNLIPEEPHP